MKKTFLIASISILVFGIACLTAEIIGCFCTPIDGALYIFKATSHNTFGFLLNYAGYIILAGFILSFLALIPYFSKMKLSWKLPKFGPWKKRRTIFQFIVYGIIIAHILLTIYGLTDIKGVCPRTLGDLSIDGILGTSAIFWIAVILGVFIWGRALCGWICVYAPVQEHASNVLTAFGSNPNKRKFTRTWLIYLTTALFWGSIIFNLMRTANKIDFKPLNGSPVNNLSLFIFGIITMFPITMLLTYFFGNRFFCKYVCPLGGLHSLYSKFSLIKVKIDHEKCVNCSKCTKTCQMNVPIDNYIDNDSPSIRDGYCIACGDCIDNCPRKALKFGLDINNKISQKEKIEKTA
jgi:ferredoxin-type protein NapH